MNIQESRILCQKEWKFRSNGIRLLPLSNCMDFLHILHRDNAAQSITFHSTEFNFETSSIPCDTPNRTCVHSNILPRPTGGSTMVYIDAADKVNRIRRNESGLTRPGKCMGVLYRDCLTGYRGGEPEGSVGGGGLGTGH